MGGQASTITYSVPVTPKKEGETPVYRSPLTRDNGLSASPDKELKTMQDVLIASARKFKNQPYLFSRNKTSGKYESKTFNEVFTAAEEIGSGIINLNLAAIVNEYDNLSLKLVAVLSKNREEWLLVEYSNFLYGNTMVPLYDTLGSDNIRYILNQTNIVSIFCSLDGAKNILKLDDFNKLKTLVVFDEIPSDVKDLATAKGINLLTLEDVRAAGRANKQEYAKVSPSDLTTFSYTSGTTGEAKATMLTHANFLSGIAVSEDCHLNFSPNDVHLSYLPLPHVKLKIKLII